MNLKVKDNLCKKLKHFPLFLFICVMVSLSSCYSETSTDFSQMEFPDYVGIGDLAYKAAYEWQDDAYLGQVFIYPYQKRIDYHFYSNEYPLQAISILAYYDNADEIVLESLNGTLNLEKNYEHRIALDSLEINAEEAYEIAYPIAEEIFQGSELLPSEIFLRLNQDYRKSNHRILNWQVSFLFDQGNIHIRLDSSTGEVLEINHSDNFNN